METTNLITILQASIAPFVLISGIGLLLLSMTNRIARPTDIIRRLLKEMENAPDSHLPYLTEQVTLLRKRCGILRTSIALSILAIVCVGSVTLLLYASLLLGFRLHLLVEILFGGSLVSLIASLLFLMQDIRITLNSIDLEIERYQR